jgi:hypothetical protein
MNKLRSGLDFFFLCLVCVLSLSCYVSSIESRRDIASELLIHGGVYADLDNENGDTKDNSVTSDDAYKTLP